MGELIYDKESDVYELVYDKNYAGSKNAIPLGPDLDLFVLHHRSKKGNLFPSLIDRIPDKDNPAYGDYCQSQGIAQSEKNPILLLGFIGNRGPSSFIFEPVYRAEFSAVDVITLRKKLQISQYDLAAAFAISKVTLQRIESGASRDIHTLKLLQILFTFPEVALWQLQQTGGRIHRDVLIKLIQYFESKG
ncbi:MAG TPA: helix-turn-helix domain-containing protein [Gammaproteobacteria bacterium]|nr:helix-turn-helix domain-containing protein [Gammaproteobacteria bacterium]